ncbi:MOSC domain-containing protein [Pedobacter rhodius]|uniref:MOSC domain-containing protein n=1 Tax=Pedobacter rhodius TaxID=3004098 RepID=A0ABT4L1P6_9SPHI|nr:MOSC N-terminal beta barrel domain-containing protein [Pedobacter sp. SJ11]MCZ4225116.1 MOSC domain-containing protein [Pedobacter sp. SJ11]
MNELYLTEIHIYPIKSLGGISLSQAMVEDKGLQYDRRWMLVDASGTFISQRKHESLALLQVEIQDDQLLVYDKRDALQRISFPITTHSEEAIPVVIWEDETIGFEVSITVSEWFSQYLKKPVKLVLMSEQTKRNVDQRYALNNEIVSFADGYPCLIIGQSSLDLLNEKLDESIPMNRFRPNFVFAGGVPHLEDRFLDFKIGDVVFKAVKPCARCVLITVNQSTGEKGAEPLKTLSGYRLQNNKVMFGQNLIHKGSGMIKLGEKLQIKSWK